MGRAPLTLLAAIAVIAACAGETGPTGPTGPQGPAGPAGVAGPSGSARSSTFELNRVRGYQETAAVSTTTMPIVHCYVAYGSSASAPNKWTNLDDYAFDGASCGVIAKGAGLWAAWFQPTNAFDAVYTNMWYRVLLFW